MGTERIDSICLCAIGRLENRYAREFVTWHRDLGFSKVVIYDNNRGDEEHFEEVLKDFIESGFVDIVDFRDRDVVQLAAYNDCYARYGSSYDWMMFLDFDEFLVLKKHKTIQEFLQGFSCDVIKLNRMLYGDSGLVHDDGRPLNERFTVPIPFDKCLGYTFPENNHVKSIVRCGLSDVMWRATPHIPCGRFSACNADGKTASSSFFENYSYETAYLKHFSTKTIEEYLHNKMVRGVADRNKGWFSTSYGVDWFFRANERTPEKMELVENFKKDNRL